MRAEWQNKALALGVVVGLLCYVTWLTDAPFPDNVKLALLFAGSGVGLAICVWITRREMKRPTSLAWRSPTSRRATWGLRLLLLWQAILGVGLVLLDWLLRRWGMDARLIEQIMLVSFGSLQMLGFLGVWGWSRSGE